MVLPTTSASARSAPPAAMSPIAPARADAALRILVVDADRRVRDSLTDLIACEAGLTVVAAVGSAAEATAAVAANRPDVVVIDPLLPDLDVGLALLESLRAAQPAMRLLVLCWPEAGPGRAIPATIPDARLDKSRSPEDIVAAIAQSVRRGA